MGNVRIGLGIIEDNLLLLKTYDYFFSKNPKFDVIFRFTQYDNVTSYLEKNTREIPDIIFLDLQLGNRDGSELIPLLIKEFPHVKIIVVSANTCIKVVLNSFRMGAHAYISKDMPVVELAKTIENVLKYESDISPDIANLLINQRTEKINSDFLKVLSQRELQVAVAISQGKTYREIAMDLSITVFTVNYHLKNIYRKLNVKSKSELIALFFSKPKHAFY